MNPHGEQYNESMNSGSSQQPSWDSARSYQSSRVSPTQAYHSYTFEPPPQIAQATMYHPHAGPSGISSGQNHAHTHLPTSWSGVYSHPQSYGQSGQSQPQIRSESALSSSLLPQATAPRVPSISGSSRTPRVGPRKTLTDEDRREICLYHRQHPDKKQTEIGGMCFHATSLLWLLTSGSEVFGVERRSVRRLYDARCSANKACSTISKILRQKEKFLGEEGGPATRLSSQIEQQLFLWGAERERSGQQLTLDMLKRQGRALANTRRVDVQAMAELEKPSFLEGFIQRNPGLTSFSYLRGQPTPSDRPSIPTIGSFAHMASYTSHYNNDIPNRLDINGSFAISNTTSTFPTSRDTYTQPNTTSTATCGVLGNGFGYGPSTGHSRSKPFSPSSIDSPGSANWTRSRNYILSSTNPDPAGSPPLVGLSPGLREFDLTSAGQNTITQTGSDAPSQTFASYSSLHAPSNALTSLPHPSTTSQLPIINKTWSESQAPMLQLPGRQQAQHTNRSSPTSTAVSSTTDSASPGGTSLSLQPPARSLLEDEDRALAALTSIVHSQSSGSLEGESIQDMTVGRLMERLYAGSRARSREREAGSSYLRRPGPDGDESDLKRHRMQ
jgi:hypothetical protein